MVGDGARVRGQLPDLRHKCGIGEEGGRLGIGGDLLHHVGLTKYVTKPTQSTVLTCLHFALSLRNAVGQHRKARLVLETSFICSNGIIVPTKAVECSTLTTVALAPIWLGTDAALRVLQSLVISATQAAGGWEGMSSACSRRGGSQGQRAGTAWMPSRKRVRGCAGGLGRRSNVPPKRINDEFQPDEALDLARGRPHVLGERQGRLITRTCAVRSSKRSGLSRAHGRARC
mmetsp:Transcript_7228/g.22332  ORF Transcript_7228/g.22332 Transcript_7228/m.22332 type:complete len:230 (+) Transcript_7228:1690-2379(+)